MTTLDAYAAFLAARWDEIEQDLILRDTLAVGHALGCIYEGGWEGTTACDCGAIERASTDLAAKRVVVALLTGNLHEKWDDGFEAAKVAARLLPLLAEPFRDHPDHPGRQR